MREILFRAKRLDNKEWIYGAVATFRNVANMRYRAIIPTIEGENWLGELKSVDPDTVGQYIGEQDKTGERIFEGDILRWVGPDGESGKVYVRFSGGVFGFQSVECPLADPDVFSDFEEGCQTLEVIGNIHDNPELLKEANHEDPR